MPDSFGKRNREKVKARKAEVRDERRIARNRRRKGISPTELGDQTVIVDIASGDTKAPEQSPVV